MTRIEKTLAAVAVILALVTLTHFTGCTNGPTQQDIQALGASVNTTRTELSNIRQQIAALPPTTQSAKISDTLGKLDTNLGKVQPVINAAGSSPDPTIAVGAAVSAAAPLAGPYAPYLALAGLGISLLGNIIQQRKNAQANAALTGVTNGVQAAVASGQLTVTNPNAGATVDSHLTTVHPATENLVATLENTTPAK